jgi:DNA-binding MarR family transcriptional regulator
VSRRRKPLVGEASLEIRKYQTAVDRFDDAVVAFLGINRTDGRCLDILDQRGPSAAGELARECGLTTGAMTTLLDRLERLGYLRRVPHPSDRRRVIVELTDRSRARIEEIFGPLAKEGSAMLAKLSEDELILVRDVMRCGRELLERHLARVEALSSRSGTT